MEVMVPGPHVPLGYDSGLLSPFEDMTEQQLDAMMLSWCSSSDPPPPRLDVPTSPGKQSDRAITADSASLSPGDASPILTPTSTLLNFPDGLFPDDQRTDIVTTTPSNSSGASPVDEFIHLNQSDNESTARRRGANLAVRPPPTSRGSLSAQPALSTPPFLLSPLTQFGRDQWHPSPSSPSLSLRMANQQPVHNYNYGASPDVNVEDHALERYPNPDLLSNMGEFDNQYPDQGFEMPQFGTPVHSFSYAEPPGRTVYQLQHSAPDLATSMAASVHPAHPHAQHFLSSPPFSTTASHHQSIGEYNAHDFAQPMVGPPQGHVVPSHPQIGPSFYSQPWSPINEDALNTQAPSLSSYSQSPGSSNSSFLQSQTAPLVPSQPAHTSSNISKKYRPPVRAGPSRLSVDPLRSSHLDVYRRGGRRKNSHLPEQARTKTNDIRKMGACWACALQRDPCDRGDPCPRCAMRSQRGQTAFFGCDRTKLPDLVHDFLPPSMTVMHQKQSIEDCVNEQVLQWDYNSAIDIYLVSGYGPALRWKLYEFMPRTPELLKQFQYFQNVDTGQSILQPKYSPPYGLLKLDTSDEAHFKAYLSELLKSEHLLDLGWSVYEEECLVDDEYFQAQTLQLMCELYLRTRDTNLKSILREIISMMIITFIMSHTLCIAQETLYTVLSHVKHSKVSDPSSSFTSPRLANRQLKFFFSVLRTGIYEKILKEQQSRLRTGTTKESTWLASFCVMLGFAMVLEEVQRTIQIQADAKAVKGEMSRENATTEAENACRRIDDRYNLLIGLFQSKYRDKKWGERGSFGNGTPELDDPHAREFLGELRNLVDTRYDHLQSRSKVEFAPEKQCLYTTRLTARFLLPFTSLPP